MSTYDPEVSGPWSDTDSHPALPGVATEAAPSGRQDPNLSAERVVTRDGESAAEQEARVADGDVEFSHPSGE